MDDLADQLSVSRVPVREALLQLQVDGLVDMEPHMGAVVSPVSLDSVNEVFLILEELEVIAGRAVAERGCPKTLTQLAEVLGQMDAALEREDLETWAELNTAFHGEIGRASDMLFLQQITEKTLERWDRVRRFYLAEVLGVRVGTAHQEHHAIYEALRRGDASEVERLLRHHNKNALNAYLERISEKEQFASLNG